MKLKGWLEGSLALAVVVMVCAALTKSAGSGGADDCSVISLESPSPTSLIALTLNLYRRPACSPVIAADVKTLFASS